jgi:hypothetical protein
LLLLKTQFWLTAQPQSGKVPHLPVEVDGWHEHTFEHLEASHWNAALMSATPPAFAVSHWAWQASVVHAR